MYQRFFPDTLIIISHCPVILQAQFFHKAINNLLPCLDKLRNADIMTEELESQSMKRLAGVIARTAKNSLLQKAVFSDWLDLFQTVAEYQPEKKKVLVIDKFHPFPHWFLLA